MRVLIVEDEPHLAEAIRDGLRLEAIAADIAFPSIEAMEQILAMGTDEGLTLAVSQIDAILAEGTVQREIQRRAAVTTSTSQPNPARREPRP